MMITAIPTLGGKIAPESDTATEYTLVEGSGQDLTTSTLDVDPTAGLDTVAAKLAEHKVQRMLAANLSQEFMAAGERAGFQIFYGATGTISDALNLIRLGILDSMANGCGCSGGGCGGGSCDSGSCGSEKQEAGGCGSGCGCGGH